MRRHNIIILDVSLNAVNKVPTTVRKKGAKNSQKIRKSEARQKCPMVHPPAGEPGELFSRGCDFDTVFLHNYRFTLLYIKAPL